MLNIDKKKFFYFILYKHFIPNINHKNIVIFCNLLREKIINFSNNYDTSSDSHCALALRVAILLFDNNAKSS